MAGIVIVGAGQAGAAMAARLRSEGYDGPLTLLGAEPDPPYQRPPLSKAYLLGEMERERLFLRPLSFYAENGIELHLGTEVAALDAGAKRIALGTGETIGYSQLALTTGATPRRLPAAIGGDLDGVFTVRGLADIDALAPRVVSGARAVILGGGYIGLEAAAVARKRGMDVTVIEMAPRILARVASPETAAFVAALHEAQGVRIRTETALARLEGDDAGAVTSAVLESGEEIPADLVIAGIGVTPDTRLAEAAGLTIDNGIAVDSYGRTSDPAIWAAGDCASFPWRGRRMRLESVQNAIDQAEAAARNMLGANEPYDPVPWFWSDQYDLKLQMAGLGLAADRIVVRPGGAPGALSHWYFSGDTLLAVDAMNDPRAYMVGKRLLEMGRSADPEALADPETNLKALLR